MKLNRIWQALKGDHYARYDVLYKFMRLFTRKKDDFFWNIYTHHYRGEMEALQKDYTLLLKARDYEFSDQGGLVRRNGAIKPLHHHWRLLYETIVQLQPATVLEVGCGNGMNLHNLQVLAPGLKLFGLDRSEDQIAYLREMNPHLSGSIRHWDAADPFPGALFPAPIDVCYSQAVIMHIKEGDKHVRALQNMFRIARKQVVLLENWLHHDFMQDVLTLQTRKMTSWDRLYLYYRTPAGPEQGNPHIMICSAVPLPYPELTDYAVLRASCDAY